MIIIIIMMIAQTQCCYYWYWYYYHYYYYYYYYLLGRLYVERFWRSKRSLAVTVWDKDRQPNAYPHPRIPAARLLLFSRLFFKHYYYYSYHYYHHYIYIYIYIYTPGSAFSSAWGNPEVGGGDKFLLDSWRTSSRTQHWAYSLQSTFVKLIGSDFRGWGLSMWPI